MRYIELNPVRAGMVAHPCEYPWSSYRANAEGRSDALVAPHGLYQALDRDEVERRIAYCALFKTEQDAAMLDAIRDCTNKGWALGSGSFKDKLERLAERRAQPLPKGRRRAEGLIESDPT